ncbi:MAG: DUF2752 domain-containing protein [Hungatella sp.]|nr:DUF2752 domain-containing protein [Hungatella sp.]
MFFRNLWDLWKWSKGQGFPCLFHALTGLYCPGCGGTRAVGYLLHGDLIKSLQYHPLPVCMATAALIRAAGYLSRRIRKDGSCGDRGQRQQVLAMIWAWVGILLVNWAIKNWFLVVMGIDLLP